MILFSVKNLQNNKRNIEAIVLNTNSLNSFVVCSQGTKGTIVETMCIVGLDHLPEKIAEKFMQRESYVYLYTNTCNYTH